MRSQKLVRRERKSGSEEKAKSKQCLWRKAKEKAKLGKERKDITNYRKAGTAPCEKGWKLPSEPIPNFNFQIPKLHLDSVLLLTKVLHIIPLSSPF